VARAGVAAAAMMLLAGGARAQTDTTAVDSVAAADTVAPTTQALPSIVRENIVVHYWPGGEAFAEQVAAAAEISLALPGLPDGILEFPPPVRIYLPPDEARFDSVTGGRAPEWGAGVAIVDSAIIVLPGFSSLGRGAVQDLGPVLRHELAHVALHRYLRDMQIPRWFSEGYATWAAGQLDPDAAWMLRLAFLTGRAPPLDSLALDWPARTTDARIAYLISASVIGFLAETGGERGVEMLIAHWRETGSFDDALRATYTMTTGQLEEYWGRFVRRRYGWLLFFAQTAVIWVIVTILVVVLYVIRRRRNKRKLERLRATEIPDDPAFWLEQPAAPVEHADEAAPPRGPHGSSGAAVPPGPAGPPNDVPQSEKP
jgi:Peptidase MA superfamily